MRRLQTRRYPGEPGGRQLAEFLNHAPGRDRFVMEGSPILAKDDWTHLTVKDQVADQKIVGELIDILHQGLAVPWAAFNPDSEYEELPADFRSAHEGYCDRLNALFRRVRFAPGPSVRTVEVGRRRRLWDWKLTVRGRHLWVPVRMHVMDVLNLANDGLLHRLRRCQQCTRWFYAKAEKQLFCCGACRERQFRTTPEGRERRRLYMQHYRDQPSAMQGKKSNSKNRKERKR
jgi:hypothetical protein